MNLIVTQFSLDRDMQFLETGLTSNLDPVNMKHVNPWDRIILVLLVFFACHPVVDLAGIPQFRQRLTYFERPVERILLIRIRENELPPSAVISDTLPDPSVHAQVVCVHVVAGLFFATVCVKDLTSRDLQDPQVVDESRFVLVYPTGWISFAFIPPELKPITISQRWKNDDGANRSKVAVEIEPGQRVRVIDARMYADKNGEPFVMTDIDLDFDLGREIAAEAMKRLADRAKAGAA